MGLTLSIRYVVNFSLSKKKKEVVGENNEIESPM